MINWENLEKFITAGKVVTLVVMVDGKEIGALSFNVDTLAYKEMFQVEAKASISIPEKSATTARLFSPEPASNTETKGKSEKREQKAVEKPVKEISKQPTREEIMATSESTAPVSDNKISEVTEIKPDKPVEPQPQLFSDDW